MSRSSTLRQPDRDKGADMYATMLAHSERIWYILGPGIVSPTPTVDRERAILDTMSIPCYVATKNAAGHSVQVGPTYWSREKAERAVDASSALYVKPEAAA